MKNIIKNILFGIFGLMVLTHVNYPISSWQCWCVLIGLLGVYGVGMYDGSELEDENQED